MKKIGEIHGISINSADWVDKDVMIFGNEMAIQNYETNLKPTKGSNQYVQKVKMITKFKSRLELPDLPITSPK